MFYDPAVTMKPPRFKHTPYKALIAPRPIGWISTVSADGVPNLAPFSFFNGVAEDPPCVMFCPYGAHMEGGPKDTLKNVTETGEFVYNMVGWDQKDQMNITSGPEERAVDEMKLAGLEGAPCEKVAPLRVKDAPASFECKHLLTVKLPTGPGGTENNIVIGQVVGIHINEAVITEDGMVDMKKIRPLARLGYMDYTSVTDLFALTRPGARG